MNCIYLRSFAIFCSPSQKVHKVGRCQKDVEDDFCLSVLSFCLENDTTKFASRYKRNSRGAQKAVFEAVCTMIGKTMIINPTGINDVCFS